MVSIVVPVFKAEKSIARCIESLLGQTYKDIEVILVDDGSPDHSGDICKTYCEKDNRVKYYKKENGGVASARNYGLKAAKGEFIQFVDSDDYIQSNMTETLYNAIIENNADLAICGFKVITFRKETEISFGSGVYAGYDAIGNMLVEKYDRRILNTCWGKLYKKELIVNEMDSYFPVGEDLIFNVSNLEQFKSIVLVNECFYIYDCRNESLTRSAYKLNREIIDKQHEIIAEVFLKIYKYEKLTKMVCRNHLRSIFSDFANKRYSVFLMPQKAKELLSEYSEKLANIEPISKIDFYLVNRNYYRLSLMIFKNRIVNDLKYFVKSKLLSRSR